MLVPAALLTATEAQAQTRCAVTHGVHPYADNTGGAWQLELDARCAEDSGVEDIRWTFQFWAETQDGSRITEYFVGSPGVPEERVRAGEHHYVGVGAPLGRDRYCYTAVATFHGVPSGPYGGVPENRIGTHCRTA